MLTLSFAVIDAMKFADFVHAIKPNPHTDVPQTTIFYSDVMM